MQNVEGVYKTFDDSGAYLLLFYLWVYHAYFIFKWYSILVFRQSLGKSKKGGKNMILPQYDDDQSKNRILKKYSLQIRRWDKYIKKALEAASNYPNAESIPYLPEEFWKEEYGDINVITRLMCVERALAEQQKFHIVYKQYKQFIKNIENDIELEKRKVHGDEYKNNKSKKKKKQNQHSNSKMHLNDITKSEEKDLKKHKKISDRQNAIQHNFVHPKNVYVDQHLINARQRCLKHIMAFSWVYFYSFCEDEIYDEFSLQKRYHTSWKKTEEILKEHISVCKRKKEDVSIHSSNDESIKKESEDNSSQEDENDEDVSEKNDDSSHSMKAKVAEEKEETEYNDYEEYDEYEQMSKYEQIHTKHRNNIQASKKKRKIRAKEKKEARAKQKIILQHPKVSKQTEAYKKSESLSQKENAGLNDKQNEVNSSENIYSKQDERELYPKDVFQKWTHPSSSRATGKNGGSQIPSELYRNTTTSFENKISFDEARQEYVDATQKHENVDCAPWITKEESYKGEIRRGDIFWVDLPYTSGQGHKKRPCIVLQNDYENAYALTFTVLPITSKVRMTELINHIPIKLERDSMIKVENITTVNRELFASYCGHVSWKQMREISYALFVHLGYF